MDVWSLIVKEGLARNLSPRTIRTYCFSVQKFLRTYRKEPHCVSKKDIKNHLARLAKRGAPDGTINVHLCALKFFYEQVLGKKLTVNIQLTKKTKKLPEFLTKGETIHFLGAIENPKHRLMISLLYSSGMRVSELVNLRLRDLHLDQNYGWVRQGKGRKDRLFVIAESLKDEIQKWIEKHKLSHDSWLFASYNSKPLTTKSIYKIVKKAAKKAKISKNVHPHTLRHSFATHLIEDGYAITEVQPLLGHTCLDTTLIYTHLASPTLLNVKSPLDSLKKKGKT